MRGIKWQYEKKQIQSDFIVAIAPERSECRCGRQKTIISNMKVIVLVPWQHVHSLNV